MQKHRWATSPDEAFFGRENSFVINKGILLVSRTLRSQGWRVIRVWEHDLSRKNESRILRRVQKALKSGKTNR